MRLGPQPNGLDARTSLSDLSIRLSKAVADVGQSLAISAGEVSEPKQRADPEATRWKQRSTVATIASPSSTPDMPPAEVSLSSNETCLSAIKLLTDEAVRIVYEAW